MGVENYHVIEMVGEGSFGKVFKGRRKGTGQVNETEFVVSIFSESFFLSSILYMS